MNEVNAGLPLSEEEQELKTLLDRVMAGSTMQPLRDDLARALPGIQSSLDESFSILTAQKRLIQQSSHSQAELKTSLESELDAIKRRFSDELSHLSTDTIGKVTQEGRKTREMLEMSENNISAALGTVTERMTVEFNQQLQAHQVDDSDAFAAIEKQLESYAEQGDRQSLLVTQGLQGINQSIKDLKVSTNNTARSYRSIQLVVLLLALFNLCGWFYLAYKP